MADEYLTLTLDTGNGGGGDVKIKLRPDLAPGAPHPTAGGLCQPRGARRLHHRRGGACHRSDRDCHDEPLTGLPVPGLSA